MGNQKNVIAVRLDNESVDTLEERRDMERPGTKMAVYVREIVLRYLDGESPPLSVAPAGGVTLDHLKQVTVFLGALLSSEHGPEAVARYLDEHLDASAVPDTALAVAGGGS